MVATAWSDQLPALSNSGLRKRPIDDYGKNRILYWHYKNSTGGTLPAATEIDLGMIPPGQTRILVPESWWKAPVAGGATATMDIGLRAYSSKYNPNPTAQEAEAPAALVAAANIAAIVAKTQFDAMNDLVVDLYSRAGVMVFARFNVIALPVNWELEGYLTLVTD